MLLAKINILIKAKAAMNILIRKKLSPRGLLEIPTRKLPWIMSFLKSKAPNGELVDCTVATPLL